MSASSPVITAVELKHVSRLYGNAAVLRDVSLTLPAGASVVLLGENGAGKSTLLKAIAGLLTPTLGTVRVFGATPADARHRIGYMSHASMLYDELTGLENLRYFADLHQVSSQREALPPEAALRSVGLDPGLVQRVSEYSQGMRQRASLARVLLTQPDLLLLDEPFSNLDAASSQAMVERLQAWSAWSPGIGVPRTLLLTTHQAELAQPLAQTTLTMRAGRIVTTASSLSSSDSL